MIQRPRTALLAGTATLTLGLTLSSLAAISAPAVATDTAAPSTAMPARFIVTMAENASESDQTRTAQLESLDVADQSVPVSGQAGVFDTTIVTADKPLNAAQTAQMQVALAQLPGVKNVVPDTVMTIQSRPNDTHYASQWDLDEPQAGMRLPVSGTSYPSGAGTRVAVIDTGKTDHPDLRGVFSGGVDTISAAEVARDGDGRDTDASDEGDWTVADECRPGSRASDSSWHGTHVAGTIGALTNNRSGIAGVAPGTSIVPIRALGRCGGYTSDIAAGILWAAGEKIDGVNRTTEPVDVINMSLGGRGTCDWVTQRAIDTARAKGITVVVAAGNSDQDASSFSPANCRGVITVAATGREGDRAYYSNYGDTIDVSAPGGDQSTGYGNGILSTVLASKTEPTPQTTYSFSQGTSMAAPHVAGLAALMKSVRPNLSPTQVEELIVTNAREIPGTCTAGCGSGLIDATATLAALGYSDGSGDGNGSGDGSDHGNTPVSGGFFADFESQRSVWAQSRDGLITAEASFPAASGKYKAQLNGFGKKNTDHISTEITVPNSAKKAVLNFNLFVDSKEFSTRTAYDRLAVQVDGREVAQFSNKDKGSRYVNRSVDLSAYIGKKVTLRFEGREDSSGRTVFLIDDVALQLSK